MLPQKLENLRKKPSFLPPAENPQHTLSTNHEIQNKIITAITQILSEAKTIAIEKASLETGQALEKLNEQGGEIIKTLEEMLKLMIESRLLEIEMFKNTFGHTFNPQQKETMENHIRRFKEYLGK